MKQTIYSVTNFIGYHRWAFAPDEVGFLRNEHRHIFNVKVQVEVQHSDRDVEFFLLQRDINSAVNTCFNKHSSYQDGFVVGSCENIATIIADNLGYKNYKITSIEVNEDGENGAILYFND